MLCLKNEAKNTKKAENDGLIQAYCYCFTGYSSHDIKSL